MHMDICSPFLYSLSLRKSRDRKHLVSAGPAVPLKERYNRIENSLHETMPIARKNKIWLASLDVTLAFEGVAVCCSILKLWFRISNQASAQLRPYGTTAYRLAVRKLPRGCLVSGSGVEVLVAHFGLLLAVFTVPGPNRSETWLRKNWKFGNSESLEFTLWNLWSLRIRVLRVSLPFDALCTSFMVWSARNDRPLSLRNVRWKMPPHAMAR